MGRIIATVGSVTTAVRIEKLLRKNKKLTQIGLQMATGIEQALLSKFENGERVPPTETLLRLAEFYNVSIDYILCRTENPEINK